MTSESAAKPPNQRENDQHEENQPYERADRMLNNVLEEFVPRRSINQTNGDNERQAIPKMSLAQVGEQ